MYVLYVSLVERFHNRKSRRGYMRKKCRNTSIYKLLPALGLWHFVRNNTSKTKLKRYCLHAWKLLNVYILIPIPFCGGDGAIHHPVHAMEADDE